MKSFFLFEYDTLPDIICEESAPKGVLRTANTLAEDLLLVTGKKADIRSRPEDCAGDKAIIIATIGHSGLTDSFASKWLVDTAPIKGKRECYMIKIVKKPFPDSPSIKEAILIIGSDKRGTIYGIFNLSELCGVSPLVFWGDAAPERRFNIELTFDDIISKEPSVKYRGFFINDEWPAFGKWCMEQYGGVNAKAYDMVFQLLLRLKGNYMWPAMWRSSFSEDGPDTENARLADEYGVIMGASHHEPMNRAGVEWQQQYSNYGKDNTWSFVNNSKAITEFWKDGIIRNRDFENIITIGMRGENDSHLLGENATIQDNINVLKTAITVQNKLIKEHINKDLKEVPRMFAIYKEVEDFYFGIDGCDGLKGWDELDDVILLFSDDNHGLLRAIPKPTEKRHSGGYGIYYHFDYHGGPYSFEWLNHTNPVKAWEQLTMAYEYGIRDMWIVNVGDIKGNEYPLSFFMDLAYDYEKWGISNPNSAYEYTIEWLNKQFGDDVSEQDKKRIHDILDAYVMWSSVRIPESMNPDVFKNNYGEIERVQESITHTMTQADTLRAALSQRALAAYESMIYFPAMAFFASMLVNLSAGLNHAHAKRGTLIANHYAAQLRNAIPKDNLYVKKFHYFQGGKWNHMMESAHMCFRTWDDNDWTYPLVQSVLPIPYAKIVVGFRGYELHNLGHHWQDSEFICNSEMTRPDVNEITIDIDSRGDVDYNFAITCDKPWLTFSQTLGKSLLKDVPRISITATCDREKLDGEDTAKVQIDFDFRDGTVKQAFLNVKAGVASGVAVASAATGASGVASGAAGADKHGGAFLEANGYVCIPAGCFNEKSDVGGEGWRVVSRLGRTGDAIKSFPGTKNWEKESARPYVRYDFIASEAREYTITYYLSPRNPSILGGTIKACYSVNDGAPKLFDVVSPDFVTTYTDDDWNNGATDSIRKVSVSAALNKGANSLKFYAADPNVILEDIVIYPKDAPVADTHLAPPESYRVTT